MTHEEMEKEIVREVVNLAKITRDAGIFGFNVLRKKRREESSDRIAELGKQLLELVEKESHQ